MAKCFTAIKELDLRPKVERAVRNWGSRHDDAADEGFRQIVQGNRYARCRILDLMRFVEENADLTSLEKEREAPPFGQKCLVMRKVQDRRTVECVEIGLSGPGLKPADGDDCVQPLQIASWQSGFSW